MKIGFSYSRCVCDIVEGHVNIDDVLVIISRTDFDPRDDEQWSSIWHGYHGSGLGLSAPEWNKYPPEDEERFRSVSIMLWDNGKLHQPRKFGAHPRRSPYVWVDTGPVGGEQFRQPEAVQQAWRDYITLASLTKEAS
jgi:hypothetical protein